MSLPRFFLFSFSSPFSFKRPRRHEDFHAQPPRAGLRRPPRRCERESGPRGASGVVDVTSIDKQRGREDHDSPAALEVRDAHHARPRLRASHVSCPRTKAFGIIEREKRKVVGCSKMNSFSTEGFFSPSQFNRRRRASDSTSSHFFLPLQKKKKQQDHAPARVGLPQGPPGGARLEDRARLAHARAQPAHPSVLRLVLGAR